MLIKTDTPPLTHLTDTPPLTELREELTRCVSASAGYLDQYRADFETRFCLWEGQSRDGKRWQDRLGAGTRVRPWDGASDVRTFTADEIVHEQVDVMMSAYARATIQVTALRSDRLDWSGKVTILLQWLLRNHLAAELPAEIEKALQWRQTYGLAVLGVWWRQDWRLQKILVTLAELLEQAVEKADAGDPAALLALSDPLRDEQTIAQMMQRSPILDKQGARRILRQLREKGQAEVPQVSVQRNQPCWEALRPFLDVFFPVETTSLRDARWVQRRRLLTLAELETKVTTEQWDREWATALAEQRGRSFSALNDFRTGSLRAESGGGVDLRGLTTTGVLDDAYVEVWDAYYPGLDARTGVPAMVHTVWSPLVDGEIYGRHEPFGYAHGEQPFVPLVRERVESALADSRSVPEIAGTFQGTIKEQRDGRNDRARMTTIPPLLVPSWRAGTEVKIGPAAQVPEKTPGELRWMTPPQNTGDHNQAENAAELALARYFGLMREGVDARRTQLAQERLVTTALGEIAQAMTMTLQLCQQFLGETTVERVVGPLRVPFTVHREEIQGQFDLTLRFDPANLNSELVVKRMEAYQKFVLAIDTQGVVNRAKLVEMGARLLDPFWADEIVSSPEQASEMEAADERKNLALIDTGIEPPMAPEGQNYQLRLQVLTGTLEENPWLQQRIAQKPDSTAMLQARIHHLQAMAEQYGINRQIGRTGAEPGLQKLREQMQKEQQPPVMP